MEDDAIGLALEIAGHRDTGLLQPGPARQLGDDDLQAIELRFLDGLSQGRRRRDDR